MPPSGVKTWRCKPWKRNFACPIAMCFFFKIVSMGATPRARGSISSGMAWTLSFFPSIWNNMSLWHIVGSFIRLNFSFVYFIVRSWEKYDTVLVIALGVFFNINIIFLMIPRILMKKNIDFSMSKGSSVSHKYSFCQDLIIRCPSQCLSGIDLC